MSFWDGVGGALVSSAGGLLGNALSGGVSAHSQFKYAKRLMRYQREQNQQYAQWSAEQLPTMNRAGMENAGFNPILAINQGAGEQGNISVSNGIQDVHRDFSNMGQIVGSAFNFYQSMQDLALRKQLTEAKIDEIRANTAKTIDSTGRATSMWSYIDRLFRGHNGQPSEGESAVRKLINNFSRFLRKSADRANSAFSQYIHLEQDTSSPKTASPQYIRENWSDFVPR